MWQDIVHEQLISNIKAEKSKYYINNLTRKNNMQTRCAVEFSFIGLTFISESQTAVKAARRIRIRIRMRGRRNRGVNKGGEKLGARETKRKLSSRPTWNVASAEYCPTESIGPLPITRHNRRSEFDAQRHKIS